MAVLKTGAAYVPLDINYPEERISYIQNDSQCQVIVDVVLLKQFLAEKDAFDPKDNMKGVEPSNLAYIIYTSGTTGQPKGVMITHNNTVAMIQWAREEFNVEAFDVTFAATSHCFDLSVFEIFYTLSIGNKVKVLEDALEIGKHLASDEKVLLNTVPSSIRAILDSGYALNRISYVNLAGEAFPVDLVPDLLASGAEIRNLYGPSEDTTYSTCYKLDPTARYTSIPIGKPLPNTQAYILDAHKHLVGIGIVGTLHLSGNGLAAGYLNRPELTAEKFIENPFVEGGHIYDTGDLAKWLPDGNIEFLGRDDHQVKLRGYRIELEEIENVIMAQPYVNQAVVEVKTSGMEKVLAAYISAEGPLNKQDLQNALSKTLPTYMVPAHFIELEAIPLTLNGKINRKALPEITSDSVIRREHIAPRNELEEHLVKIWQEVLGVTDISIRDNFINLGGNSLHLLKVLNKLTLENRYSVSMNVLFENPTVEQLAEKLTQDDGTEARTSYIIPKTNLPGPYYPLSPTQERLWISSKTGGNKAYNIPLFIEIGGDIYFKHLEKAVNLLARRHESLRTTFRFNENKEIKQYVTPLEEFRLSFPVIKLDSYQQVLKKAQEIIETDFNLENGPLILSGVFDIKDSNKSIAYLVIHHLVSDGWSMEIVFQEIIELFKSVVSSRPHNLSDMKIQFKDYASWITDNLNTVVAKEKKFWKEAFTDAVPNVVLPFERKNRPLRKTYKGTAITSTFSKEFSQEILEKAKEIKVTNFAFLMAIYKMLLHKYTIKTDFTVGTPISGRFNEQVEHQIGLYLNTLPIRSIMNPSDSFLDIIRKENTKLIQYYDNQLYQLDDLVKDLSITPTPGRFPLFDYMVIFQNQSNLGLFDNKDTIEGVDIKPWSDWEYSHIQFDMVMSFSEVNGIIQYEAGYNKDVFERKHILQLIEDFIYLTKNILNDEHTRLDQFLNSTTYAFITDNPIIYELPEHKLESEESIYRDETNLDKQVLQKLKGVIIATLQTDIKYHEDFFRKGGSSIGAIQVVNSVNKIFSRNLNIVDFYNNSNIYKLHDHLLGITTEDSDDTSKEEVLVSLNVQEENMPTVIFFPPILGVGLLFKPLATMLGEQFNSYAINMPVLDDSVTAEDMMGKLLDIIYSAVKKVDVNEAPVFLVGYSAGANFAFETAKLLEKDGREANVFIIDRGPEIDKARVTKRLVKRSITYHQPLIDHALAFGVKEEILTKRIEQALHNLYAYNIQGIISSPVYAFQADNDGLTGYMEKWGKYTSEFKEIIYLKGNHLQALDSENSNTIANYIQLHLNTYKLLKNE